jgi:outer membrane immunogenic protein
MKNLRAQLLATAAAVALSGGAYAADMDMPIKAPPPPPIPVAGWQGFYVGGHIGVDRMNADCNSPAGANADYYYTCGSYYYNSGNQTQDTGVSGGAQVGYDWQSRYFVYGVVADWSGMSLKGTNAIAFGSIFYQTKVNWLASFRGRMGLAIDDTLVYFTGGLALGGVQANSGDHYATIGCYPNLCFPVNQTQVGWVAGAGVEHKLTPNWSFFGEFLYYDLGQTNSAVTHYGGESYQARYSWEVMEGRIGVNYRF